MTELDDMKAEFDRLKVKLDRIAPDPEPEEALPDWAPAGAWQDSSGLWRDALGKILQGPDARSHEAYIDDLRSRIKADAAAQEHYRAHDNDGNPLPDGYFRDSCGIVRTDKGQVAEIAEHEAERVADINREIAKQHREDLGLPPREEA
ncbi:MAG: hypothetical protein RIC87_15525 [Kiloniellales bacterium]